MVQTLSASSSPSSSSCCIRCFLRVFSFHLFSHFTIFIRLLFISPSTLSTLCNRRQFIIITTTMTTTTSTASLATTAADASAEIDDLSFKTLCLSFGYVSRFNVRFKWIKRVKAKGFLRSFDWNNLDDVVVVVAVVFFFFLLLIVKKKLIWVNKVYLRRKSDLMQWQYRFETAHHV